MATKRSGFTVVVDNKSLTKPNFDGITEFSKWIVAAGVRQASEKARDEMIRRISEESQKSVYSQTRREKGIGEPNYYHHERSGSYDSVTKGLVVFEQNQATIGSASAFTVGVGARQRGMGSVQNNYMPASLALDLIDKGFSNQGLVPLTHGREQIKSHWAVSKVEGKKFTAGMDTFMASEANLSMKQAEILLKGKFAKGWDGPVDGANWQDVAKKYYRALRKEGWGSEQL